MTTLRSSNGPPRGSRLGSAMILVLITIAIAFVMGVTFLATSTTATGVTQTMVHHAKARQIAESGLSMVVRYVQQTPNWRDVRSNGVWIEKMAFDDGTMSIIGEFDERTAADVTDPSFEKATGDLDNPLVGPPMMGSVGDWQMQRTAAIATGTTVPHMGIGASASATDGSNVATISFGVVVDGSGIFAHTLTTALAPNTVYELAVDMRTSGLPILDADFGFRILAGNTAVASSDQAAVLTLPTLPSQIPTPPAQPPTLPELDSVLEIVGLSGSSAAYTLRFVTDDSPPPGLMRIELYARSTLGVALSVDFDNVRLTMYGSVPLVLIAVGRCKGASGQVTAAINATNARMVQWSEF